MPVLIKNKKAPLHPNEPCIYLVAKQIKKDGFNEVMSGEGADGLFGGYSDLLENKDKYMTDRKTFLKRYAYVYQDVDIPFKKWKKWGIYKFLLRIHEPGLIERAQNACNSAGIKIRFPYLENGLPLVIEEMKPGKMVLKKIAEKYLPKEIVYREKVAFPIPIEKWFGGRKKFCEYNWKIYEIQKRNNFRSI